MTQDPRDQGAPYPSRRGYFVPLVSLTLSLPTLVCALTLVSAALYHALTGRALDAGISSVVLPPPAFAVGVCYLVLGPVLGGVLCLSQRTQTEQRYGSVLLLGFRMKRLNTLALYSAGLAIAVLMLLVVAGMLLRGGT